MSCQFIPDDPSVTLATRFLPRLDSDSAAGIAAVIAAGGTLTGAQQTACNTLIVGLKTEGIWTNTDLIYLYVGGTAAAHAVNWRTPGTYNITWYNSPTHSANGVQFGGTAHGRTGYNPNTVGVNASASGLFGYINSLGSGTRPLIAAQDDVATLEMLLLHSAADEFNSNIGLYAGRPGTHPTFSANGCLVSQRNSNIDFRRFINGAKTTTATPGGGTASVNLSLYIGCYNYMGSPALYSNSRQAMCGLYRGVWTDAQQTAFSTLVNAFQTSLGRA